MIRIKTHLKHGKGCTALAVLAALHLIAHTRTAAGNGLAGCLHCAAAAAATHTHPETGKLFKPSFETCDYLCVKLFISL